MSNSPASKLSHKQLVTLFALGFFLVSLLIRLVGIGWGLPKDGQHFSLHPDEDVIWSYSQRIEPSKGKFDPGFYNYGTLYLSLLRVSSDVVAGYGGGPKQGDPESFYRYIGACNMAGRVISALAGAGSVLLLFLIGMRFMSIWGASFGAAALAIAPGFVVHSRFQTVDVLATFLLICSIFFAMRLLPRSEPAAPPPSDEAEEVAHEEPAQLPIESLTDKAAMNAALFAGLFAGLSAGTKYTGILAILTLIAVLIMTKRADRGKLIGVGIGMSLLGLFIGTPGILLNTSKFIQDFKYEMLHTASGHGIVFEGLPSGFVWHLFNLMFGFGTLLLVLGIAGCFMASRQKAYWMLAILAFAIPYYILIGRAEVLFLRYTFPLLIPLSLGFGYVVHTARAQGTKMGHLAVVISIVTVGMTLLRTKEMTEWMIRKDPREEAADFLRQEASKSSKDMTVGLVSDPWFYTPTLFPDSAMMRNSYRAYAEAMDVADKPKVVRYVPANPDERVDWDSRLITETKPDYIVFSSFEADDLKRLSKLKKLEPIDQVQVDRFNEFLKLLFENYDSTALFGRSLKDDRRNLQPYAVHDLEYVRPYIWVWKRKS